MRSLILHRIHHHNATQNYLFHGCRYHDRDWLYHEEFEQLNADGLIKYYWVFSRGKRNNVGDGQERYVQDVLWKERTLIWSLILQDARIYLSGYVPTITGIT
jgi:cytochrome P450/NADPH-cytochrome P450 reductase